MILTQQSTPAPAQNLPAGDDVMITGPMGDCVSVIVLWGLVGQAYQHVRGYHGSGGFLSINLNSLFNGVPNNAATRIIGCFSPQALSSNDRNRFTTYCQSNFPAAQCIVATGGCNFRVERNGDWAVQQ
jgi:hypothetical protein